MPSEPDGFREAFPGQKCSLGYDAAFWVEQNCCHGPGDLQGEPAKIDDEMYDFIVEAYRIDPVTGRRFYTEEVLSRPKGRAKTEVAGWLVCWEAYGPCRFGYWDSDGQPVGKRVTSPLIKCLATEESQATAAFSVVAYIVEWGKDPDQGNREVFFGSTGVRQYQSATSIYLPMDPVGGEIRACSSGAASKDGGKETFVVCDESHLYVLPALRNMYSTISKNLPKRKIAQPHMLQTTTAYRQGELSIAEETMKHWRKGELGERVLVDHREASGPIKIRDRDHTMKQLAEVYGVAAQWTDFDFTYEQMIDPRICRDDAEAARYFLNRVIASRDAWIARDIYLRQVNREILVAPGEPITLGFDGSLNDDSTVLRGCRMSDGFRFTIGVWEKPEGPTGIGWDVPRREVLQVIRDAFDKYQVVRGYFDPHEWRNDIDTLAEEFRVHLKKGKVEERVIAWSTHRDTAMAFALDRLYSDLVNGVSFHDGDEVAEQHYGNAYVRHRGSLRLVRKEYPNSPRKIDTIPADALAYEARADAIADGWDQPKQGLTRAKGRARSY